MVDPNSDFEHNLFVHGTSLVAESLATTFVEIDEQYDLLPGFQNYVVDAVEAGYDYGEIAAAAAIEERDLHIAIWYLAAKGILAARGEQIASEDRTKTAAQLYQEHVDDAGQQPEGADMLGVDEDGQPILEQTILDELDAEFPVTANTKMKTSDFVRALAAWHVKHPFRLFDQVDIAAGLPVDISPQGVADRYHRIFGTGKLSRLGIHLYEKSDDMWWERLEAAVRAQPFATTEQLSRALEVNKREVSLVAKKLEQQGLVRGVQKAIELRRIAAARLVREGEDKTTAVIRIAHLLGVHKETISNDLREVKMLLLHPEVGQRRPRNNPQAAQKFTNHVWMAMVEGKFDITDRAIALKLEPALARDKEALQRLMFRVRNARRHLPGSLPEASEQSA